MSIMRSIMSIGGRCGKSSISRLTSTAGSSVFASIALISAPFSLGQTRQRADLAPTLRDRARGEAAVDLSALEVARDTGLCREGRAGPDLQMVCDADLAAKNGIVADLAAARDADLCDQDRAPADAIVVTDMDRVVDLG